MSTTATKDVFSSILVETATEVIESGTLQEQREALDALSTLAHTDEDTAAVLEDLEQQLRVSIMRKERPPRKITLLGRDR